MQPTQPQQSHEAVDILSEASVEPVAASSAAVSVSLPAPPKSPDPDPKAAEPHISSAPAPQAAASINKAKSFSFLPPEQKGFISAGAAESRVQDMIAAALATRTKPLPRPPSVPTVEEPSTPAPSEPAIASSGTVIGKTIGLSAFMANEFATPSPPVAVHAGGTPAAAIDGNISKYSCNIFLL